MKLDNGFKVIYAKDTSNPLICMQLYVRIGSAWEEKNEAGFSHFIEHLVFKSTQKFPENTISEKITFLGGHINAYTEYDSTCFYVTLPSAYFKEGMEILAEIAQNVNFNEQDFRFEKQVIIEELKQFQNDPEDSFIEEISENYFQKNPYRFPIIGNLQSLRGTSIKDLERFYQKYYNPGNSFLIISGDFQEDILSSSAAKFFGEWKQSKLKPKRPVSEDFPSKPEILSLKKNISNDMLAFVLPDLAESHPDSHTLFLAFKILAIGKNSLLFTKLFNEEKLIDNIKVHSLSGRNNGASIILIMPKKKADLHKICSIFFDELAGLRQFGIDKNKIEEQKKELLFSYKYAFEYVESLASGLGNEEILSKFENFLKYPEIIGNISKSDLEKVMKKFFQIDALYVFHTGKKLFSKEKINKSLLSSRKPKSYKISKKDFLETTLKNGLKILFKKVKGKPTIGIALSVNASQLHETQKNRGLNLMTSSLMLYGNKKQNHDQFLNSCSTNGINFSIFPGNETTTFRLKCFKDALPASLKLLSEVVSNPTFPKDYFENLLQTFHSNLDRIKDYPHHLALKLWREMIFGKQSNLLNKEGTKSSLRRISLNRIRTWHQEYFQIPNMTLTIVGDLDFQNTMMKLEKLFPTGISNLKINPGKAILMPVSQRFRRKDRKQNQSIISIGGFGCSSLEHDKNMAFHVLAQIIGGDTNSILFRELREKKGLAYSVDFEFRSIKELGYFLASVIVDRKNEIEALDRIISILKDIRKNGITGEDLEKTKNYIHGQRLFEEENMLAQAHIISVLETTGFGCEHYLTREERLKKVNLNSIHRVAEEYLKDDAYFIHVLS